MDSRSMLCIDVLRFLVSSVLHITVLIICRKLLALLYIRNVGNQNASDAHTPHKATVAKMFCQQHGLVSCDHG